MSGLYLKRLQREHKDLLREQPPYIEAHPDPSDILKWHFAVIAPPDSPFEDGIYWGQISFPPQYPMAPPSIKMMTPSGRFVPNQSICFSMSAFHPELWQPSWTVRSICIGFLSFMQTDELTTGGMVTSDAEKRELARKSIAFNAKDPKFCKMFPHLVDGVPKPKPAAASASSSSSSSSTASTADKPPTPEPEPEPVVAVVAAVAAVAEPEPAPAPAPAVVLPKAATPKKQKAPAEMSVKELKAELKALGVSSDNCQEKIDMVKKLEAARAKTNNEH